MYDELISFRNLHLAWCDFRLGKSHKEDVIGFEHNLENGLFCLQNELANLKYQHGHYKRFVVNDPKYRIIHKAEVRDRIVHTLVSRKLEEIYQNVFISHSYSCQRKRGTHRALFALAKMCRCQSRNYSYNFWYLKCDIRKFFDNINHDILLEILWRKVKDEKFMWLINQILQSFFCGNLGIGLPLGNFTSQWFGNIYLNEFDYFIKHDLRIKNYVRYADDFLIIANDANVLKNILGKARQFLFGRLKLTIHPNKIVIKKFSAGIDWVGYKIFPHYLVLRKATRKRMFIKLAKRYNEREKVQIGCNQYFATLNSYFGQLHHCRGYKLSQKIKFNQLSYDHAGKIF